MTGIVLLLNFSVCCCSHCSFATVLQRMCDSQCFAGIGLLLLLHLFDRDWVVVYLLVVVAPIVRRGLFFHLLFVVATIVCWGGWDVLGHYFMSFVVLQPYC